ncbi:MULTISPECIES: GFA family protein [unclassified Halomonas]|uniref:GFA family protein n=1 Tax=unclassified Halomonas TaxID=2609666 RepID=UPI0020A1D644|nr:MULTISPECIES: GFA family protein [unclassified Halomonas]MCP1313699.1 GFA family protein [Halomonas sp. 707D7]MCP1326442.1 GFA family protein [Halomonas sp. 707D4]
MTLSGSCLCGGIQYEITGPLTDVYHCHCSMCRKLHAAAFRTCAKVQAKDWRTVKGEELLKRYESSPGEFKVFCFTCGSSIHTRFKEKPEVYALPLGTLDVDPGVRPNRHVFVGNKAPWFEITDDLPQFTENG